MIMQIQCPNCGAIQVLNKENVCCYCKFPVNETNIIKSKIK